MVRKKCRTTTHVYDLFASTQRKYVVDEPAFVRPVAQQPHGQAICPWDG
jgi:hypothetical protein